MKDPVRKILTKTMFAKGKQVGIHVDVPSKNLLIPLKRFSIKNFTVMFGWKNVGGRG